MTLSQRAVGLLLGNTCILCQKGSDSLICPDCQGDLPTLPPHLCPQCSEQTTHGETCGACLKNPPNFDRVVAAFRYDFPLDRIIHALKYGHQLAIAAWLAERMAALLSDKLPSLIVPLPLHPQRLCQRGFNQSMEIARAVGSSLRLPVDWRSLQRRRSAPAQAELPLKARRANVRGAFECVSDMSGRDILLVDDVMTSGATLDEAARVLKLHGAGRIIAIVAARALKHESVL